MHHAAPLPSELDRRFSIYEGAAAGLSRSRMRGSDLEAPFRGIRVRTVDIDRSRLDPFTRQVAERRERALDYGPRLRPGQYLSHESAAAICGAPLPLVFPPPSDDPLHEDAPPLPLDGRTLDVHVSTIGIGPLVRASGVKGHRSDPRIAHGFEHNGYAVGAPAITWAQLGHMSLLHLVALGDYFCRVWRAGPGRPDAGRPPWTTIRELQSTLDLTRWAGIVRLRQALELIREDSWSPRESQVRCHLVLAGLPEPHLNHDVYDDRGRFIGCVDLAYPERKIAIEYQGVLHSDHYAADVERIAALRAAGWTVIEVTSALFAQPDRMIERVRAALRG